MFFQFRQAAQHVGQAADGDVLALGFPVGTGRRAEPLLAVGNVIHHAGLRADRDLVANLQVPGQPGLRRDDGVAAEPGAAGYAALPDEQAVLADDDVVRDLHEVVDFRAAPDDGRAERAAINARVRANLDIVVNDDVADLKHLAMLARVEHVAVTVRADDRAGVDADAMANLRVGVENDAGEKPRVLAEL